MGCEKTKSRLVEQLRLLEKVSSGPHMSFTVLPTLLSPSLSDERTLLVNPVLPPTSQAVNEQNHAACGRACVGRRSPTAQLTCGGPRPWHAWDWGRHGMWRPWKRSTSAISHADRGRNRKENEPNVHNHWLVGIFGENLEATACESRGDGAMKFVLAKSCSCFWLWLWVEANHFG